MDMCAVVQPSQNHRDLVANACQNFEKVYRRSVRRGKELSAVEAVLKVRTKTGGMGVK